MCRLLTGIRSEKGVIRQLHRVNVTGARSHSAPHTGCVAEPPDRGSRPIQRVREKHEVKSSARGKGASQDAVNMGRDVAGGHPCTRLSRYSKLFLIEYNDRKYDA